MARTLFVVAILLIGTVAALTSAFYGLLFYLWIAYFRPETWLWDPTVVQILPISLMVGVWTLVATIIYGTRLRLDFRTLLLIAIAVISTIATFSSPYYRYSYPYWTDFMKCIVITYLIAVLVNDERRVKITFAVIGLSLGLEAAKQGLAQLVLNPGAKNFNYTAVLGDENLTAVGMFMLAPLLVALAQTSRVKWQAHGWRLLTLGVIYRGVSTYSRGGFLAAGAVLLVYIWRSPHRVRSLAAITLVGVLIVPVLPDAFWGRMSTIAADEEERDASASGRLHFWNTALRMVEERPFTGVGHNAYNAAYDAYDTTGGDFGLARSVHSSWFGILAELGYPGLFVFMLSVALGFLTARRARKLAALVPDGADLARYAIALECGFVAFIVGGSFVILQYNEITWHFIGLSMALDALVHARLAAHNRPADVQPAIAAA